MPQYAPQYTRAERLRKVVPMGALALLAIFLLHTFFFPWFNEFSANAHCRSLWGISGTTVVFYSALVLVPILVFIFVALSIVPRALKILASGQYPPPGEKTYHLTRIRTGLAAQAIAWGILALTFACFIFIAWGIYLAQGFIDKADAAHADLAPCPSQTHTP